MKTYEELLHQWDSCHGKGQVLVDHSHPVRMFLNINDFGNREILIPVNKPNSNYKSSVALGFHNYMNSDSYYFAIELKQEDLVGEYIALCHDLIESSRFEEHDDSVRTIFQTLKKWYRLMSSSQTDTLPEEEIKGLIGEILFMSEKLNQGESDTSIVAAWTDNIDASRDFIFDNSWFEIKATTSSKDYISISSLEQLDHENEGFLVVFKLDRSEQMNDGCITLNKIVQSFKNKIGFQAEMEFNKKLTKRGYMVNPEYDAFIYRYNARCDYRVDKVFPRISKKMISDAIIRARYDILLSGIERWKVNG